MYRRHRWLVDVSHRTSGIGPDTLAWFDNCLRVLAPVRCGVTAKFEAIAMMTGVVGLFARSEARPRRVGQLRRARPREAYPHLTAAFTQPTAAAPPERDLFERTLRSLLTGLLAGKR